MSKPVNFQDAERKRIIESPTRPNHSAVETVVSNISSNPVNATILDVSKESKQDILNSRIGIQSELAATSDTAASGLNGRLQRIAQRITSLITAITTGTGALATLRGATTGAQIGNVGDALKVIQSASGLAESGKLFSVSREINTGDSGVDNPLFLLKNPSGSAKQFFIWRARLGSVVTNTSMLFKFYINPTVTTNGTQITPLNRNIGGINPLSQSLFYINPTVSSLGTLATVAVVGQNTVSIDLNENFSIILQPNTSLLITGNPSSNNRAAAVSLVWQEN